MEKIIKNCRGIKKSNRNNTNRENLGFKENDILLTKEQSVSKSMTEVFEEKNMQTQYSVLDYRTDFYFHDYKLAVEVYEKGHKDRIIDHEI